MSDGVFAVCRKVYTSKPSAFLLAMGSIQLLAAVCLVVYGVKHRRWAQDGRVDERTASGRVIFPQYFLILYLCAFACGFGAIVDFLLAFVLQPSSLLAGLLFGAEFALFHFVFEGVAILLCFSGVGYRALLQTALLSAIWAIVSFVANSIGEVYPGIEIYTEPIWSGCLFVFYLALWLCPTKWLFRRPAIYRYAIFWCFSRALLITADILRGFQLDLGHCFELLSSSGLLSFYTPYAVYAALLHDSQYWQGALDLSEDTNRHGGSIRSPLLGVYLRPSSARAIAGSMDTKGVKRDVPIINFASLHIDALAREYSSNHQQHVVLGAGSSARVFRGTWRGVAVAIKMIYCVELTPDVVANFYREASLLAGLVHQNIVQVHGVCVLPPAICMVMELCECGNLYEYLHQNPPPDLIWKDKLRLLRGCAAAIAFLHSQRPPILHLDLKSPNFLLSKTSDGTLIVKCADFELSREYVTLEGEGAGMASGSAMTGFRVPDTVNWLAPEIILGQAYNDKADVYALAMTMWEVLTNRVPFEDQALNLTHPSCLPSGAVRIRRESADTHSIPSSPRSIPIKLAHATNIDRPRSLSDTLCVGSYTASRRDPEQPEMATTIGTPPPFLSKESSEKRWQRRIEARQAPVPRHQEQTYKDRKDVERELKRIICEEHFRPRIPADTPERLTKVLLKAWSPDPVRRPSAKDICDVIDLVAQDLGISVAPQTPRLGRRT